jgi:hypothetical protein
MQPAAGGSQAELRLAMLERKVAELTAAVERLGHGTVPTADLPETVDIAADGIASFGVGFHPREFDQSGVPYRWTGHGDFFELRAALDRSAPRLCALRLRVPREAALDPVTVFVDYAEVAAELVGSGADLLLRCTLPLAPASGRVVVTVYAPNTAIVEGSIPAQAGHRVGVMFYGATITPVAATQAGAPRTGPAETPRHG